MGVALDEDLDEDAKALLHCFPRAGRLEWIGLRPRSRSSGGSGRCDRGDPGPRPCGDHCAIRAGSKRQVTLIQAEHLLAVGAPARTRHRGSALSRRNLVVSGINLLALADRSSSSARLCCVVPGAAHLLAHGRSARYGRLQRHARAWRDHSARGPRRYHPNRRRRHHLSGAPHRPAPGAGSRSIGGNVVGRTHLQVPRQRVNQATALVAPPSNNHMAARCTT